jgi:hypothetical protein
VAGGKLKPRPHFGLTSFSDGDRPVARVIVEDEEVAAILDGVSLSEPAVTIGLLRLVMAAVAHQINYDLTEEGDWVDGPKCAADMDVLTARLPLAARIHRRLVTQRDHGHGSMAESEGWSAEIRQMFVGKLAGFTINGEERDVLVREVRAELKRLDRDDDEYKRKRRELRAILADTGREKGTGRACTLSTLSMPTLVEWMRRLGPDITRRGLDGLPRKRQENLRRRHELIRDMWVRVRREIEVGPKPVVD